MRRATRLRAALLRTSAVLVELFFQQFAQGRGARGLVALLILFQRFLEFVVFQGLDGQAQG